MGSGSASASLVGQVVYGYLVEALIGQGSQGDIYRLRHPTLPNRTLALKVLRAGNRASAELRRRFLQDALAASEVGGLGVAQPIHVDQLGDGAPYIVMELAPGRSLDRILAEGPLPVEPALAIAAAVAETMARVHARGIVHRDLKPGNIMVELDGTTVGAIKLLDFGVALVPNELRQVKTAENKFFGTACYMAPEMATGRPVDGRADVFSLGAVLFEMLAGATPFDTMVATVGEFEAPPVATRRPPELGPLPDEVGAVVRAALAKKVAERPTMAALCDELRALLASLASPSPAGSGGATLKSMVVPQPGAPSGGKRRAGFTTTDQELQTLFAKGPFSPADHMDKVVAEGGDAPVDPIGETLAARAELIDPKLTADSMRDTAPLDREELAAIAAGPAPTGAPSVELAPAAPTPSLKLVLAAPIPSVRSAPPPDAPAPMHSPWQASSLSQAPPPSQRETAQLDRATLLADAQAIAPSATLITAPAPDKNETETWRVASPSVQPHRARVVAIVAGAVIGAIAVGVVLLLLLARDPLPFPDGPPPVAHPQPIVTPPPIAHPEPPIVTPPPVAIQPVAEPDRGEPRWTVVDSPTKNPLFDLWGDGHGRLVAVGGAGTIVRSIDHGRSFRAVGGDAAGPTPLFGVWGARDELWAVGDRGMILHSSDGGERWTRQATTTTATLAGVWGGARDDLFVVGNPSTILHSTDGGATWEKQSPRNGNGLRRVWGRAGGVWAVGWGETILRTSDGGAHWSPLRSDGNGLLFDLCGAGDELYAVGALHPPGSGTRNRDQLILRSVDGGAHFRVEPPATRYPLYAVGCGSDGAIYAAGAAGTLIHSDGNGWIPEPLPVRVSKLSRIWSAPGESMILVGNDGMILRRDR